MKITLLILLLISKVSFAQTVITQKKLIINHGDITLYLSEDTLPMVSKHVISYSNFLKLDSDRDNKWFKDGYKKVDRDKYINTGYDLGHFTPSHITSYDDSLNHNSFSLYNQAPQLAHFNRGSWKKLESSIEDSIAKYKKDVVIITGAIYDTLLFLPNSKIKIPSYYFKILYIGNEKYCWLGRNDENALVTTIKLSDLNKFFIKSKMYLSIR